MKPSPAPGGGPPLLDAVLYPHRSLSPRGFTILMSIIVAVAFAAGLAFMSMGAWPVFGFFGLDVALIYFLFRANYRHGRLREEVRLTREALTVTRVHPGGEARSWTFEPAWLRVDMDDPPEHESQLVLSSHGRRLVIGSFLTPEERLDFAHALRRALADSRRAPGLA